MPQKKPPTATIATMNTTTNQTINTVDDRITTSIDDKTTDTGTTKETDDHSSNNNVITKTITNTATAQDWNHWSRMEDQRRDRRYSRMMLLRLRSSTSSQDAAKSWY